MPALFRRKLIDIRDRFRAVPVTKLAEPGLLAARRYPRKGPHLQQTPLQPA